MQRDLDKRELGRPVSYTPNQLVLRLDVLKFFHAVLSLPLDSPLLLEIAGLAKPDAATKNPVGVYRRATTKQMKLIQQQPFFFELHPRDRPLALKGVCTGPTLSRSQSRT